ncbi:MAG: ABC transporter permease [Fimbriimonadales bacterium]
MSITESLRTALGAIATNRLRSVLTMLGVIIGVGSVITMIGIAEGSKRQAMEQLDALGRNLILVFPQRSFGGVAQASDEAQSLRQSDVELIRRAVPTAANVSGEVRLRAQVKYGSRNERTMVTGGEPEIQYIRNIKLKEGRFFTAAENEAADKVCVLGYDIYDRLFEGGSALGATIRLNNQDFLVIGVAAFKGGQGFMNPDDAVFVPIKTSLGRLQRRDTLSGIAVRAVDSSTMAYTLQQVQSTLARVRRSASGEELFRAFNQGELIETAEGQARVFGLLLAGIAGVSLVVGGIGIMNIMLVSVKERTREVGLRKAVGATQDAILSQFLLESIVLCLLGGLIGIAVGIGGVKLIAGFIGVPPVVVPSGVVLAFGFAALVGIVFGLYPAYLASKLQPIEALREE